MGKIRRMALNVREEFEREINMAEMQQRIKEQLEQAGLEEMRETVEKARKEMAETRKSVENSIAPPTTAAVEAKAEEDTNTQHNAPTPENAAPAPPPEPVTPTESEPPKSS